MSKVLVFGTFDGLHEGHLDFLTQALKLGDELVVCVAQDAIVELLKRCAPRFVLADRLNELRKLPQVSQAFAGDSKLGSYVCYTDIQPDLVAFGYDQTELKADFVRFQQATGDETPLIVLKPYQVHIYKSSLLNSKH